MGWYWITIHDRWFLLNELLVQSTKQEKKVFSGHLKNDFARASAQTQRVVCNSEMPGHGEE